MKKSPDIAYLVIGLLFVALSTSWLLTDTGVLDSDDRWVVPVALLGAGLIGLAASLAKNLGRRGVREPAAPTAPVYGPTETTTQIPTERTEEVR